MKSAAYLTLFVALFLMACAGSKETATDLPPSDQAVTPRQTPDQTDKETRESARETAEPEQPPAGMSFQEIHFAFDSSDLTPEAREILADHARKMKRYTDLRLLIEGHCDDRGTVEYNLALGERRATSVKTYLVNIGIDPRRLYTISYGEERPQVQGNSEEAWAQNRRAEFRIVE